ncbi:17739_t:CDS:1, partial [Rhizophagus irregularis]
MSKFFCLKRNSNNASTSTSSTSTIPSSLVSDLDKLNLTEERLKRYVDEANTLSSDTTLISNTEKELKNKAKILREKAISKTLNNIKRSMKVDLCFVLDCTGSMKPHIAAAKDCISHVSNYIKCTNPSIKLRIGFCGYRDHNNKPHDQLQVFNFTDKYIKFTKYMHEVSPGVYSQYSDEPEDVLGGLNAAITQMNWQSSTRILLHIGDFPPHGRRFTNLKDNYPDGDPNGLTAENVLEKMQSKNILYFFGKIANYTDKMLEIFPMKKNHPIFVQYLF